MLTVIVVIAAALAASFLAAIAGFGGAVIMLPVLVWAVGITDAVPILTVAQIIGNLSRVGFNVRELKWPVVWRFAAGAIPTAIIGATIFARAPAEYLVRLLGVFLIVMVAYRHTRWGKSYKLSLRGFIPLGAASGGISALLGTVGPFAAPFFLSFGLVGGAYIGTEAMTAVIMHITKLAVYGSYSLLSVRTIWVGLAIGVVMILGTYLGKKALDKIPGYIFPYIIEGTMLVSGLIFIIQG